MEDPRRVPFWGRLFTRRLLLLGAFDAAVAMGSLVGALLLRFEGRIEAPYREFLPQLLVPVAVVRVLMLLACGLYQPQWRYAGSRELSRLAFATAGATVLFAAAGVFLQLGGYPQALPRSVFVIDLLLFTAISGGARMIPRLVIGTPSRSANHKPALVYGAGAGGEKMIRDMTRHPEARYFAVGLIDDDPDKWGTTIHGVPVLGGGEALPAIAAETAAEALLVAIPSATARQVRAIVESARAAGITEVRTLPSVDQILNGEVSVSQVRRIDVDDLMGREPVTVDTAAVEAFLKGKRVLVTGAGGSIGSELVRQVLRFSPSRVCCFDHDETELFNLLASMPVETAKLLDPQVADVRDRKRVDAVFSAFRPQVVFHAAAYKHVPMLEAHPGEAVATNVLGTSHVARAAAVTGCEAFVLISTDKAVNPTSVMGATKRVAEMVLRETGRDASGRFAAVRFGNVLGSRGSVVLTFRDQIARGGPVTVTHPDMKRYFMTVGEACLLVLQAATLARGGEVFVLDMGQPVRILDLAREMIRLSGLEPDHDVAISITGIRPGEKLFEEYLTAEEGVEATRHQKIFVARITHDLGGAALAERVADLERAAQDPLRAKEALAAAVPTYRPAPAGEPTAQREATTS